MKLKQILNQVNQVERSKFVNCLDRVRNESEILEISSGGNLYSGQLKSASDNEIVALFNDVKDAYKRFLSEQISLVNTQSILLINILLRDGNCVARLPWIEKLYEAEFSKLNSDSEEILRLIDASEEDSDDQRLANIKIYRACFSTAFSNDLKYNRDAKVTEDERTILNTLAEQLGISNSEICAIENIINPVDAGNIISAIDQLRDLGIIFINKRTSEVLVADEVIDVINGIFNRELTDKHTLRVLRTLSDSELSQILKYHSQKIRNVSRADKIKWILHSGISVRNILMKQIFSDENLVQRKERLKYLIEELNVEVDRIGVTLEDRVHVIINSIKETSKLEFNKISSSGYQELLHELNNTEPSVTARIREEFEIESIESLDPERLRLLNITPLDILYLYSNDEIKLIKNSMSISKRGNNRFLILEKFASANDKLIENYELVACRDIKGLGDKGIDIKEANIGIKFEELTHTLLEKLELNVDDELKKSVNSTKDKIDILVSIAEGDVIIFEVKSHKNSDYSKYSSVSRQVKSYVSRCESSGLKVSQVVIVAPGFSNDFINASEMDADINISLLEARGLKMIVESYVASKNPKFSYKLLMKGGLLKADLIAKSI